MTPPLNKKIRTRLHVRSKAMTGSFFYVISGTFSLVGSSHSTEPKHWLTNSTKHIKRQTNETKPSAMCLLSTASHYQQSKDVSTEMLASAVLLVSLSETAVVNPGYKARTCFGSPPSSANSSATALSGLGSAMTRSKSYKVDLCLLGSSSEPMSHQSAADTSEDDTNASWGFYTCTQ